MNIFTISPSPVKNALILDDLRLNKMILETAQLLSSAYRSLWGDVDGLYKTTHINHPCSIWARAKKANFKWLYKYFVELHKEFKFRKDRKDHLSFTKLNSIFKSKADTVLDNADIEFNFNCTDYKHLPVFEAYKRQLIYKWNRDIKCPTWTNRVKPKWA
jgi:hypothetical protein